MPLVSSELQGALALPTTATSGPVFEVTAEDVGGSNIGKGLWETSPLNQLLAGDEVHVRKSEDGVDKLEEAFNTVGAVAEPSCVEEEWEGSLFTRVVLEEVLSKDLLNGVGILIVETAISHGTGGTPDVVQGGHGDLPHAWV